MAKLDGKVAFITGASQGIGEGIADVYAKHGAKLILADISKDMNQIAQRLITQGHEVLPITVDVTDKAALKEAANKGIEKYGKIDILVCNAGVCKLGNFLEMNDSDRDFHIDVNLKGVWNTAQAVLPYMVEAKYGNIVIMSSVTGDMVADAGEVAYAMTKASLVGFTKALAVEMAPNNIRVNAICPGYVRTPMAESIAASSNPVNPEQVLTEMAKAIPMQRLAKPSEVGELAAFLGSDESSYMTGTQSVIDGGSTLPESVSVGV